MNYLTNTYENNDNLDDPNPDKKRRKSRSYSSSYLDPFRDDKDCSPSSCSFSIHGPTELENDSDEMIPRVLEDGSDSRSSLKRCHKNSGDYIGLKKRTLGTRVETEQSMKIEGSKSEKAEQLTALQNTNTISGTKELPKQVTDDVKKNDMKPSTKNLEHFRQFMMRKDNQWPSQRVLEEFTGLKMCETIYQHNHEMLRQLRIKDMAFESLRTKYITLEKQISDMDFVQTRILNDMRKAKDPRDVVPVKITRSIGLQVNMQPLTTEVNLPEQVPLAPDPLDPISGPLKKQTRDESNSPHGNILQKSPTTSTNAATASLRKPVVYIKVIDLTDEDDSNRTSTSPGIKSASGDIRVVTDLRNSDNSNRASIIPGTQLASGDIRVVASHQSKNISS